MSDSGGNSSVPNGISSSSSDTLQRLSSFKTPRDLTLGGGKPNKKVFTPNLNVSRNKNKGSLPTVTRDKRDDKFKKDKKNDKNRNLRNGPNVIKSSGVFSEGIGAGERRATRAYYGRDADSAPTLQKPTIRVKDVWKIDKELDQQKVNKVFGNHIDDDEAAPENYRLEKDAPIKLPLTEGGWLYSKPKVMKAKQEVQVKLEPIDEAPAPVTESKVDVKKESPEEMDIVTLLRSERPALIMLQFPDSLPGNSGSKDDDVPKKKQTNTTDEASTANGEQPEKKNDDNRCRLADLEEGRIGKLLIHRSGKVRLELGDSVFEVAAGTQASFRQEVVSVATDESSRSASVIALGALPHKFNLLPHWETMLSDITI